MMNRGKVRYMHKYHLYSSSRLGWVKKPAKGCVFCGIAKGDRKVPEKTLYKGKDVIVVMNLYPYNTGHLQVFPVRHVEDFEELSDNEIASLFSMVKKCVKFLKKVLNPAGFNIGLNIGSEAGGSVRHLHVHIVPRFPRDYGFMEMLAETKVMPESLDKTFERLKKEAKMLE